MRARTGDKRISRVRPSDFHVLLAARERMLALPTETPARSTPHKGQRGWAVTPRNDYPADWPVIAKAVKDAANWRCIRCDHPHSVEGWHILTVHHLDGDKANGAWWNLLALCQRCHLKVQARVAPERPYLFNHSLWFVPYVCGFYAQYYGNLHITRDEAVADPHRFLRMGQPWLYRDEH